MKNRIDKYFNLSSFVSLALVLPATIVIISFILRVFNVNALFELFMKYERSMYFFTIVMIMCAVSVIISFAAIISANLNYNLSSPEQVMNRSYFKLALLFFPYAYAIFIFFFLEFEKFGNTRLEEGKLRYIHTSKILRLLIVLSIITPFFSDIYLLSIFNFWYALTLFYIYLLCFLVFVFSAIVYYYLEVDLWKMRKFFIWSFTAIFILLTALSLGLHNRLSYYLYYLVNRGNLEKLSSYFDDNEKIIDIDCNGYINSQSTIADSSQVTEFEYFRANNSEKVIEIIELMRESNVYRIHNENRTTFFTTGGFMDELGIAYSRTNKWQTKMNKSKLAMWIKLAGNWYWWWSD